VLVRGSQIAQLEQALSILLGRNPGPITRGKAIDDLYARIAEGRLTGFVSGLGAASADAVYGSIAAFGLTAISAFLVTQILWILCIFF